MTNGDYLKQNISDEIIIEHILKIRNIEGSCEHCPVAENCDDICKILSQKLKTSENEVQCEDIISYWLKTGNDRFFYSHKANYKPSDCGPSRYCTLCKALSWEVPITRVCLDSSSGAKKFADICENCFPKFCEFLGVSENMKFEPNFTIKKMLRKNTNKQDNRTICAFCGTKCSPKHHFCHECGHELDN